MALKVVRNYTKEGWYRPLGQEEDENPYEFKVRVLNKLELQQYDGKKTSLSTAGNELFIKMGEVNLEVFRKCVIDWKNISDENNEEVKFKKDKNGLVDNELIQMIPSDVINEVGLMIQDISAFPDKAQVYLGN